MLNQVDKYPVLLVAGGPRRWSETRRAREEVEAAAKFPVYGPCAVVCGDFEFFQSSLCVSHVLWCVRTLKFFKIPLCVGSVL